MTQAAGRDAGVAAGPKRRASATAPLPAWRAMVDSMPEAAWVVEVPGLRVAAINAAAVSLLALSPPTLATLDALDLVGSPEDLAFWDEVCAGNPARLRSDSVAMAADGRLVQVTRSIAPLSVGGRPATHYLVAVHDRTDDLRAQTERETLLAELQATLESTGDGILVTDLAGRIRSFNRRFASMWGMPEDLLTGHQDDVVFDWMRRSVTDAREYQRRLVLLQDSALMRSHESVTLLSGQTFEMVTQPQVSRGRPIGRVWAFRDRTELVKADRRIEALATTDALTDLPNRRHFADALERAIDWARHDGSKLALLLLDLDRFKQINDSLGMATGDRVLIEVADRIRACLREGDVLARVGGDQFAMLVQKADHRGAEAAAQRVLEAMDRPYTLEGTQFTLTCSVGIALLPSDASDAGTLLRHAESAMREAKLGGRAAFRFHQHGHDADLRRRMRLDHAMRQALAANRFRLAYQPQLDIASDAIVGAEALIRWRDPELGDVPPGQFIPVAEESGFIIAIGDWVLGQAVRQAALWRSRGLALPVAVNVSALQFQQADFVDRVARALGEADVPGALLELELTESILVRDAGDALQRLHSLALLGVKLAIDDFGTGYSSLAYLKRFPIEKLKIDRSFIRGVPGDDSDEGIVHAIIQMARALNLRVIAEGVETDAQRQFLAREGCDQLQGYLVAPALDAFSFEERLRAQSGGRRRLRVVGD